MTDEEYKWRMSMWDYHALRNKVHDVKVKASDLIEELDKITTGQHEPDVYHVEAMAVDMRKWANEARDMAGKIVEEKEAIA